MSKRSKIIERIKNFQNDSKKVVFTNGCFDIIHRGHVEYLKQAKELGDILIVGLNSDSSVKRLKGKSRPFHKEEDRLIILKSLKFVDDVIIFEEDTPLELIIELKPDVLVKGGDYTLENIVGAKEIRDWGGTVKTIPFIKGYGTSKLVQKIVEELS